MKWISRQTALEQGLLKYYTGIPCKYEHVSERYTKTRTCVTCSETHLRHKYSTEEHYQRAYGISIKEFRALLRFQNNRCAICNDRLKKGHNTVCVDHNHKTGAVRGILCRGCNCALGLFKDDPEILFEAANYLLTRKR